MATGVDAFPGNDHGIRVRIVVEDPGKMGAARKTMSYSQDNSGGDEKPRTSRDHGLPIKFFVRAIGRVAVPIDI